MNSVHNWQGKWSQTDGVSSENAELTSAAQKVLCMHKYTDIVQQSLDQEKVELGRQRYQQKVKELGLTEKREIKNPHG